MKNSMKIIDLHCDTLLECWKHKDQGLKDGPTAINIEKLREGGSLAQCFAMYLPWKSMNIGPYEILKGVYETYKEQMELNKDAIRPALSVSDIEKNAADGMLSSILTIEDGAFLENKIERLDEAYEMGVRMIGLIWNHENCLAYPNNRDKAAHERGLKVFGMDVIERMNELGMVIDCSHLNEGGFFDVAKLSKKPFMASHSCARALCDHPRNLSDEQLHVLGEKGGVVGINFYGAFLNESGDAASFDRIIEHLKYMKDKAGIDAIALGSDFDGIDDNGELVDFTGYVPLMDKMSKHFSDDEIEKISHLNAMRVFRENIGR